MVNSLTQAEHDKILRFMVHAKMMLATFKYNDRFYLATLTDHDAEDAGVYHYDLGLQEIPPPIQLAF